MLRARDRSGRLPNSPAHAASVLELTVEKARQEFNRIARFTCKGVPSNRRAVAASLANAMMAEHADYRQRRGR